MLRCERASVRLGAAFLDLSATSPTSPPPLYVSHISLSKISPHLLAHCTLHGVMWLPIRPTPHSLPQPSPRTCLILCCSLLALAHRASHPRFSLLTPIVPLACLRLVPAKPRAPMSAARVGGTRTPSAPTPRLE
jgi:hypothetical protein